MVAIGHMDKLCIWNGVCVTKEQNSKFYLHLVLT